MPTSTSHMERAIIEHTCWPRALLAYTVLALLVSPSATAGEWCRIRMARLRFNEACNFFAKLKRTYVRATICTEA